MKHHSLSVVASLQRDLRMMVSMAFRASILHAAARAVTFGASRLRRKQDVRRVPAVNRIVALRAGNVDVLCMIEFCVLQPALRHDRLGDCR